MNASRLKALWIMLTGGVSGILKYGIDLFNTQVLGKISNKEEAVKYVEDAKAVYSLISAILKNHESDLTPDRKASLEAILAAVSELTNAIDDFEMTEDELTAIVGKIKIAIDVWKAAK